MKLTNDIDLLEGMPIAHIKSIDSLVVADLHLGYEGVMAKKGTLLPKINLKKIIEMLTAAIKTTGAPNLIVDGDIKNEFSTVDQEEFNELFDFINFAKEKKVNLILIKGNHDNFVERYREPFKLVIHRQEARIKDYLFFHGEELPRDETANMFIMGHEHPAIGVYNNAGTKEKIPCFLYGTYKRKPLLVLPAMNYFATGTAVNFYPKNELLAPIFKHIDVDKMRAIAVGYGSTIDFGTIGKLRKLRE